MSAIEDIREYNSVILAAMLHDLGKFLHRGRKESHKRHEIASADFIKANRSKLINDSFYDIDLVGLLVKHHHSKRSEVENELKNRGLSKVSIERLWRLERMVVRADEYSCAERDRDQQAPMLLS